MTNDQTTGTKDYAQLPKGDELRKSIANAITIASAGIPYCMEHDISGQDETIKVSELVAILSRARQLARGI